MQHNPKWNNWPVLLLGIVFAALTVFLANIIKSHQIISNYLADLAGAISSIIISIATYDEWERRQQRKRYKPPEELGLKRIKNVISRLLYQYAFITNSGFEADSQVTKAIRSSGNPKRTIDLADQASQSGARTHRQIFKVSTEALKKARIENLTNAEALQLINQIEETVHEIDMSVATYGYSFMPEIHHQVLKLREELDLMTRQELEVLNIKLAVASDKAKDKLSRNVVKAMREITDELLHIGHQFEKLKAKG